MVDKKMSPIRFREEHAAVNALGTVGQVVGDAVFEG